MAGSLSSRPTGLTMNGRGATIYADLTYAVTAGLNIADGMNTLTAVVNGTLTNGVREVLPVSEELALGHYTRVAQAVSRMQRQPGKKLAQLKRRLLQTEKKTA